MSGPDRHTDRIVRAWLEAGVTQFPDKLLDAVLDELPGVRQRQPSWLTRRFEAMTISLRIAIAAIAAIAVVSGGAYMFSGSGIGGPGPTPTPVPTETPAPTPSPTPTPLAHEDSIPFDDVSLEPGSYSYYESIGEQELRVTLTVPAGWTGHESWYVFREPTRSDGGGVAVSPWLNTVNLIYPDPCQHDTAVGTGSTAAELAAAFAATPMHVGGDPVDISVSGYAGKQIQISTDPAIDDALCRGEAVIPWVEGAGGSERHVVPGTEQTLWILDVDGSRLVIDASAEPGADATQRAQLIQVLESVRVGVS